MENQFEAQIKQAIPRLRFYNEDKSHGRRSAVVRVLGRPFTPKERQAILDILGGKATRMYAWDYKGLPLYSLEIAGVNFQPCEFNRKTFDPLNKPSDKKTLNQLRQSGTSKAQGIKLAGRFGYDPWGCGSIALRKLRRDLPAERGIYIDLGCGNSPDCVLMTMEGYQAVGFDLFPRTTDALKLEAKDFFARADVAEDLPLLNNSAIAVSCQAMLDLIEPTARPNLYANVYRILRPSGVFSLNAVWLKDGWGFDIKKEVESALNAGLQLVRTYGPGFIVRKV
jgi:hypothetical protein